MVLDLRQATQCIETMKKYGTYRNNKIGRIKMNFPGDFPNYKEGDIVLFKEYLHPSDSQLCLGEYRGFEQKPTGRVTVESPMSQEEIKKEKENKTLITTKNTIVFVPIKYLEEILM